MAADWTALTMFLRGKGDRVTLDWNELENIVGGMPASAIDHQAWWGGDRPHTRAWKAAGFEVVQKRPGTSVTFRRVHSTPPRPSVLPQPPQRPTRQTAQPEPSVSSTTTDRVVLVACAKSKANRPMAAQDLYVSARFRKARRYAESLGGRWFILSAEHGLVGPTEWLAPYERYLPDTPRDYQRAWGEWVVARLQLLLDGLDGLIVEVHAGEAYAQPLLGPLQRRGAVVDRPLEGLTSGRWQGWYDARAAQLPAGSTRLEADRDQDFHGDPGPVVTTIADVKRSHSPAELAALERVQLDGPGLYGWFVDEVGAEVLSRGLNEPLEPGLVYVGQTGATKWPSGTTSRGTLLSRITSQHLRGRRSGSTLRRTFGAVLDVSFGRPVLQLELSEWMASHLRVVPLLVEDADSLGDLERRVVQALKPPLNLDHVGPTPIRLALKRLRKESDERETE